jgi:hypothetical protein
MELILNLFEAYQKVEDKEFSTYIMVTRFGYVAAPNTYEPRTLMSGVENLYKMRVQAGTWQPALEKSPMSELSALSAKVVEWQKDKKGKGKQKIVKNEKNAWKFVVPSDGDPKVKEYDGRTYNWCHKHGYWTMHHPSECKLQADGKWNNQASETIVANTTSITAATNRTDARKPTVQVNEALRAYIETIEDDDDDMD